MALTQRLQMRQSQALVMTPQLMQAIKLLQLSNLDLAAYVEGELERNPFLEHASDGESPSGERERTIDTDGGLGLNGNGHDVGQENGHDAQPADWVNEDLDTSRSTIEARLDTDLENVFPDDTGPTGSPYKGDEQPAAYADWGRSSGGRDDGDYNLEAFVSSEVTLAQHLSAQLALAITDPARRMIGQYLIDMVDEAGYLSGDLPIVSEKLGAPPEEVEAVVAILQTFDPPGVCARNLTECIAIQLKDRDRFDPAMQALVSRLDLLAKRDLPALRRLCGVSDEDLTEMIAEIRALNPKPGLAFGSTVVQPIVPDVFVRPAPDGSFIVELNSDTLPKVLVNQTYHAKLSKNALKDADRTFLTESMQSATWLIRALDQRAKTILKVSTEIVKQQDAFFAHGVQYLKPLNLKTIADAIGMHESTVSRVTANKYMATNRGIFELKYFFTSAISSSDGGDAHSAEAVRHRIKQLIDAESPTEILSDDAIVEILRGAGIDIARRTVAKYRDALRIPSSVQRRREKQAAALVDNGGRAS
jgi:RNA polymerase sigma-54 factor